jgi:hypothetical protein
MEANMPWSRRRNKYFSNQYEADMDDAKCEATLARARAGVPASSTPVIEVEDIYSDGSVRRYTTVAPRRSTAELRRDLEEAQRRERWARQARERARRRRDQVMESDIDADAALAVAGATVAIIGLGALLFGGSSD